MVAPVELKVGGNGEATHRLRPAVDFLQRTIESSCPANTIVLVESQSSLTTGAISYGNERGESRYATLPDVISTFLGSDMLVAMSDSSNLACRTGQLEKPHFFQDAACYRGGWRGLVLVAEGPTVRIPPRKDEAIKLVDR